MHKQSRQLLWGVVCLLAFGAACRKEAPQVSPAAEPYRPPPPPPAPPPPDPAAIEDKAILDKVGKVFGCFDDAMTARRDKKDPELALYKRNAYTDMFVFHSLVDEPGQLDEDADKLCASVVARYRRAFSAELARKPAAARAKDAPPPDATPEFVRETHNRTGLHVLQHADITRAAGRQFFGAKVPPMFELVVFGAEQPDLYNKEDSRFHAQYHRATLVGHLTSLVGRFAENARRGRMATAAVHLGAICHVVQDAAFYKGMTIEEVAGLIYDAGKDPYTPTAIAEATRLTKYVLGLAENAVSDDKAWREFVKWSPRDAGYDTQAVLRELFGRTVPLAYDTLTRHWLFSLSYKRTPERRKELANGAPGLARWDADLFVAEALGPGGVAQPSSATDRSARRVALPSRPR